MRRFALLFVVPTLLCLGAATASLIAGTGTLYDRDVLNSHYPLKAAQAEMMRTGRLPLIDPYHSGGQPLVGNLNAVPLYPDNVLYLFASPLWALNAHFWLHLLIAPLAGYWLGRAWGSSRPAAWATGAIYATSGFVLSQMNLYNLVAGAALAPAFIAACLDACSATRRGRSLLWAGGLWALLILGGDPLFGLLALLMAIAACLARHRRFPPGGWQLITAGLLGSLIALPQIVELLRILPHSFRGYWRYSLTAALSQSWDPRTAVEWVVPFFFGPPDLSFWGFSFFGGNPPLFYSLYPGVLSLCLLAVAGRPRSAMSWWAWGWVASGLFLALGSWNPLIRGVFEVFSGSSLMRFPIKCWIVVAIAASVLCGRGFERVLRGDGRRRLSRLLGFLALLYVGLFWAFARGPAWLVGSVGWLDPEHLSAQRIHVERVRWASQCLGSLTLVLVLAMAVYLMGRRRLGGGAVLLAVHVAGQLYLLQPLVDSDPSDFYTRRPALLDSLPSEARIVQGGEQSVFGPPTEKPPDLPDLSRAWIQRTFFDELYPSGGIPWGRRYELTHSPEGLDTFALVAVTQALAKLTDEARVRVLASLGVDRLLLDRPLAPEAEPLARLLETRAVGHKTLRVYEIPGSAPEVMLAGAVRFAPHLNAGLAMVTDPDFDPQCEVVILGEGNVRDAPRGTVEILHDDVERLEVMVDSAEGGMLLTQRAHLPIYRAEVDGAPAQTPVANLQRIAVRVPAGRHRVVLWVDRRPFGGALLVALLAAAGLVLFGRERTKKEGSGDATTSVAGETGRL